MATILHPPPSLKYKWQHLVLKSWGKKTAAIISQMSLSPLEKKAALWEIKAHPLEGVDGISENGTPF